MPPPDAYWNLAGSLYAYLYIEALASSRSTCRHVAAGRLSHAISQREHDGLAEPIKPNARYWVLKLIKDNFHPGDKLVETDAGRGDRSRAGICDADGRKLLLANKRDKAVEVPLTDADNATARTVDRSDGRRSGAHRKAGRWKNHA